MNICTKFLETYASQACEAVKVVQHLNKLWVDHKYRRQGTVEKEGLSKFASLVKFDKCSSMSRQYSKVMSPSAVFTVLLL